MCVQIWVWMGMDVYIHIHKYRSYHPENDMFEYL